MDVSKIMPIDAHKQALPAVSAKMQVDEARKAAQQFEAVMLSQSFSEMFKGVTSPSIVGGGHADKVWEAFLIDEIAKTVAETRSIGIAEKVYKELGK